MQCCGLCHRLLCSGKSALTAHTVLYALSSHCPSPPLSFLPLLSSSLLSPSSHFPFSLLSLSSHFPFSLLSPPHLFSFTFSPHLLSHFLSSFSFYSPSRLPSFFLSFLIPFFFPQVFNGLGIRLYCRCTLLQTSDRLWWLSPGFHRVLNIQ